MSSNPEYGCYTNFLSIATTQSKSHLIEFVNSIQPSGTNANYEAALTKAFHYLNTSTSGIDSNDRGKCKTECFF